jgi:hypothetical protein
MEKVLLLLLVLTLALSKYLFPYFLSQSTLELLHTHHVERKLSLQHNLRHHRNLPLIHRIGHIHHIRLL